MPFSVLKITGRLLVCSVFASLLVNHSWAQPRPAESSAEPLSPAQAALFDTPHLANVQQPETLQYAYRRTGPDAFDDMVDVRIVKANSDGTRDLTFDYLTGAHHVFFPELDGFHGNPLFMLALENDVNTMHEALKLSAASFRNRIRAAFLDAPVVDGTATLPNGTSTPARIITLTPFAREAQLAGIPSLQAKTYRFVLADAVPGQIAEIDIETPANPAFDAPALSDTITFTGVKP